MKTTQVMTPEEAKQAEAARAANLKATGGYDATKGPDGKDRHKATKAIVDVPDDEIRDAVQEVVDSFKGKTNREQVVGILRTAAEQLNRSGGWVRDPDTLDYDPDDLDDPRANPMGLRPMPKGATRADEHTAMEPDSLGTVAQRKAAEAGINEDIDVSDVPPMDREAVAIKRAAQKSVDQFGTAGGTPTARAEHKDDPKPRKK